MGRPPPGFGEPARITILAAAQRRRIDVEDHVLVLGDGDLVTRGRHLVVGPGGRIRPFGRLGWRSCVLGLDDSEYAAEQDCRNQRCKKDRSRSCTHGDYPLFSELSPIREWHKSSATIQRPAIWTGVRLYDSRGPGGPTSPRSELRFGLEFG